MCKRQALDRRRGGPKVYGTEFSWGRTEFGRKVAPLSEPFDGKIVLWVLMIFLKTHFSLSLSIGAARNFAVNSLLSRHPSTSLKFSETFFNFD